MNKNLTKLTLILLSISVAVVASTHFALIEKLDSHAQPMISSR